jgi:CheY-like chemotaxis protein
MRDYPTKPGSKDCVMKELSRADALEVISACFDLLARREREIRSLYERLQEYEPVPGTEGKSVGSITPDIEEAGRRAAPSWPGAVAVCGTPLVGRSLMLLCPQMGLRIQGITDSGLEGLSLVERYKPEFAFVDLDVNDIDGLVLISRMRELAPNIHILAIAVGSNENTLVSATIAGARDVIAKPLQAGRVLDIVKRILKQGRHKAVPTVTLPPEINPASPSVIRGDSGWTVI